jgi:hypothetical protein
MRISSYSHTQTGKTLKCLPFLFISFYRYCLLSLSLYVNAIFVKKRRKNFLLYFFSSVFGHQNLDPDWIQIHLKCWIRIQSSREKTHVCGLHRQQINQLHHSKGECFGYVKISDLRCVQTVFAVAASCEYSALTALCPMGRVARLYGASRHVGRVARLYEAPRHVGRVARLYVALLRLDADVSFFIDGAFLFYVRTGGPLVIAFLLWDGGQRGNPGCFQAGSNPFPEI